MEDEEQQQSPAEEIAGQVTERLGSAYEQANEASNGVLGIVSPGASSSRAPTL